MDTATAHMLNRFNREFYARHAHSFSQSRSAGWPGWNRVLEACSAPSSVLDIACGNKRFKRFLTDARGSDDFAYFGVDACEELADWGEATSFQQIDLVEAALDGNDLVTLVQAPPCDLTVAFAFMHHVPGRKTRMQIMELLAAKTAKGGVACISFWNFMDEPTLAEKARVTSANVPLFADRMLDEGDYFLDWQGDDSVLRYCHSFSAEEIDELVSSVSNSCVPVQRFESDGRNQALNTYVILRKR